MFTKQIVEKLLRWKKVTLSLISLAGNCSKEREFQKYQFAEEKQGKSFCHQDILDELNWNSKDRCWPWRDTFSEVLMSWVKSISIRFQVTLLIPCDRKVVNYLMGNVQQFTIIIVYTCTVSTQHLHRESSSNYFETLDLMNWKPVAATRSSLIKPLPKN